MDDLFDRFFSAISEHFSSILDSDICDTIMDHASDMINHTLSTYGENLSDIDETKFNEILDNLIHSLEINDIPEDSLVTINFYDNFHEHRGQPTFTGICWEECLASVGDPGKRLTCGYHA